MKRLKKTVTKELSPADYSDPQKVLQAISGSNNDNDGRPKVARTMSHMDALT